MIGQTFGNYRIDEKRGEGGMGMFFRATDLHLDRIVGLKTLRPELVADPDLRERLHGEARSLARLVHQNIANVLHYLVEDDYHFIVMEYIDGKDLGEVVKETGLIPIDRLAAIVPQICAAVSYAHHKGVIHRDLKPSNIMVTAEGEVKVTDFGIAKILGAQSQTRTGVAPGSLQYMAPEQISGSTDVDQRSDVYQLGATLYELCTGKRPFVSDNEYELMTMHLNQMPELPSVANNRVPPELDTVILKALAKSPDDRFQSCDELAAAYQSAMAGVSSGLSDKTEYAKPRPSPPRAASEPEDPTVVAPSPRRAKHPPAAPDVPPPPVGKQPGRSKVWIFLTLMIVAVAAVAYFMYPFGADRTIAPVEVPPEPKVEVAPMCSLLVSAELPSSLKPTELSKITLTLDHADSGQSSYDLRAIGTGIREGYVVAPTTTIAISITGVNEEGKAVISGSQQVSGTVGTVDAVLTLKHTPAAPSTEPPQTPPQQQQQHNLALTITPFSARETITRVWIDDKEVSTGGDFEYKVQPGRRVVRLALDGGRLTDSVMVRASGVAEKTIFVGAGKGRLSVGAVFPGAGGFADIWLDGVKLEDVGTPTMLDDILEGPHMVDVRQEGYHARGGPRIVTVTAGGKTEVSFDMIPD